MRWLGWVLFLAACAGAQPQRESTMLVGWPDAGRDRIESVIASHPRGSVAVFDWDNTMARGDVGDVAFAYMLDHDLVRWPDDLSAWGALTPSARASLEAACVPPIVTSVEGPCRDRLAQVAIGGEIDGVAAFDPAIGPRYRGNYGMMVRAFAGMDEASVTAMANAAIDRALAQPVGARRTIGGVAFDDFLQIREPMRALADRLREAGWQVWIVSATFEPIVAAFAARVGIARDHVIGARLEMREGRYLSTHPFEDELGPLITFDEGKRFWIRHEIFGVPIEQASTPGEPRPVIAAGDSDTDLAMLESASALRILIDRGAPRVTALARSQPGSFVLLPPN